VTDVRIKKVGSLPRTQSQAGALPTQILQGSDKSKTARLRSSHIQVTPLESFRNYPVKGGTKRHVPDRYTEFWRGTMKAFPEGLAGFASA
jgi:hypothetical protein